MKKKRFFAAVLAAAMVFQASSVLSVSAAGIIPDQTIKQIILKDAGVDAKKAIAYTMDKTDYGNDTYSVSFYVRNGETTFTHYTCTIDKATGIIDKRDTVEYTIVSPEEAKNKALENEGLLDTTMRAVNVRFGEYNGSLVYKVFLHNFGSNIDPKLYDQRFSTIFPMDQKELNSFGNSGYIYLVNAISGTVIEKYSTEDAAPVNQWSSNGNSSWSSGSGSTVDDSDDDDDDDDDDYDDDDE